MVNRLLCCVYLLSVSVWASAQTPLIQLKGSARTYPVGRWVEYAADPLGTATLTNMQTGGRFIRSRQAVPSFGFNRSVYWFRLRVQATADPSLRWLFELGYSHFQTADLYVIDQHGRLIQAVLAGNSRGAAHRPLPTHNYVFPLDLPAGQPVTLYLRCDGMASQLFPLTLYEQHTFYEKAQQTSLWLGFYFGFLFITILYHFLLFLYRQPHSYLLFSGYLLAYLLNELIRGNGNYVERIVLVHHPFWQQHVVALLNGVIVLVSVLGLRFYAVGLQTDPAGWLHKGLVRLSYGHLVLYGLLLTGLFPASWSLLFNFVVPLLSYVAVLAASLWRIAEGYRPGWYYFTATLILCAGVVTVLLERAGWLTDAGFWQHNAIQLASVVEIILLSLGFAEGVRAESYRQELEKELSNLAGRKSEREWLSVVLHTSFGSTLSAILFDLSRIDRRELPPSATQIVDRLQSQLYESLNELRILARSLPPKLLDEQGLQAAFSALIANYNKRNQVRFHLLTSGTEKRLDARQEFELYLIGLELVNNVIHHADASAAWLELIWERNKMLTLRLRDNGRGFGAQTSSVGGYGLESIRRMVEQRVGGTVEVVNAPGGGGLVTVQVHLTAPDGLLPTTNNPIRRLFGGVRLSS